MREYRLLNNNWKFTYGDKVGASPDEINRWQDIGLPHSFGIPYFMEKELLTIKGNRKVLLFGIWNLFQMV